MTLQRTDEVLTFTKEHYIDKTQELKKGIETFPSIFIEGAAESGKTVAVNMLMKEQKDTDFVLFLMDREKDDGSFIRKLSLIRRRMEKEKIWVVCENMNQPLSDAKAEALVEFVKRLADGNRCIFVSREKPHRKILELLWKEKMHLISQKSLLFSIEEIESICKRNSLAVRAKDIFRETGGWPGCVCLLARMFRNKMEAGESVTLSEMRNSYEVADYIDSEILGTLSKRESDFLEIGSWCPWINGKMCEDIWKISDGMETIKNLERKGFLTECGKEQYATAALFRKEACRQNPKRKFWMTVGAWYEAEGFIKEGLFCMTNANEKEALKTFAIRNYAEIPFIDMGFVVAERWKETIPEICFLRGMNCYFSQNIEGMDKEIRKLEKQMETDSSIKIREIYLNLLYIRPDFPLDLWLELIGKDDSSNTKIRIYNVLGASDSYLGGLRDLSDLFSCSRKEENRKMRIWKENLDAQAWEWYQLARKEYYIEIGQEKREKFENKELIQQLRDGEEELTADVKEENYQLLCRYGKAYMMMRQYDKAEKIFEKLVPFLKPYHKNRILSEILFAQAVCIWEKGSHGQALRYVIESFLYSDNYRYVLFYTEYGNAGKEVLTAYVEWMKQNSPEGWHRKKKYNYGNVRRMPKEDYLELILRMARKQCSPASEVQQKAPEEHLTMMESIILGLIGKGRSNAEICEELNLKLSTVKSHIYSLYRKLGVKNRMQATIKGKEMGILK